MSLDGFDTLAHIAAEAALNGLWQGLAVSSMIWLALRLGPRTGAATRYSIWWATLSVVLLLPFLHLDATFTDGNASNTAGAPIHLSASFPSLLLGAWIVIAALMLGRLVWSYGYVSWLARTSAPLPRSFEARAARLTGSRRVRIRASHQTDVPGVIGFRSPVILIPAALLDTLSAVELDQVVLHEWAHIRRHDHWTNGVLELLQSLFFFHPAVWTIGRALRLERELACDDSVVAATGQPVSYAGCLARLVELRSAPPISLAASALGDARHLFRRVNRLLHWQGAGRFSAFRFASSLALLLAAVVYAQQLPKWIDIPAPGLTLKAPQPAVELNRRTLVAEERVRAADIFIEIAQQRLASANRMMRAAQEQMRLAVQIAQGSAPVPVSRVACRQPGTASEPKLSKI